MKHTFQCEYCKRVFYSAINAAQHEQTHCNTNDSFGGKLAKARMNKGMSQRKLADITGVCANLICNYESNKVSPKVTTLELLCKALDVTAFELLGF